MCWSTQLVLTGRFELWPLGAFIFFGTLCLYALHRLVGLSRAEGFKDQGRYFVIERFRSHISLYALLAGLATIWFAWQLPWRVWWWLLIPAIISLAYVFPIFSRRRRLRDFHYIKIFFIALAWSWITVWIPAVHIGRTHNLPVYLLLLERFFFITAIGIPFDIRDLEIDRANGVKTIPTWLGITHSKWLAVGMLLSSGLCAAGNYRLDAYAQGAFLGLMISLILTAFIISFAGPRRHDYYFSGLVDGAIVMQFFCVWAGM